MLQYKFHTGESVTTHTKFLDCTTAQESMDFLLNYLRGYLLTQREGAFVEKVRCYYLPRPLEKHMAKITKEMILSEPKAEQERYKKAYQAGLVYIRKKGGLHYQHVRQPEKALE